MTPREFFKKDAHRRLLQGLRLIKAASEWIVEYETPYRPGLHHRVVKTLAFADRVGMDEWHFIAWSGRNDLEAPEGRLTTDELLKHVAKVRGPEIEELERHRRIIWNQEGKAIQFFKKLGRKLRWEDDSENKASFAYDDSPGVLEPRLLKGTVAKVRQWENGQWNIVYVHLVNHEFPRQYATKEEAQRAVELLGFGGQRGVVEKIPYGWREVGESKAMRIINRMGPRFKWVVVPGLDTWAAFDKTIVDHMVVQVLPERSLGTGYRVYGWNPTKSKKGLARVGEAVYPTAEDAKKAAEYWWFKDGGRDCANAWCAI